MKILLFSNSVKGIISFRIEFLQTLVNKGDNVIALLPNDPRTKVIRNVGVDVIDTPIDRRGINPITDIKLWLSYISSIKSIQPDVVLTYTIKPNIYGGIACRLTKTPYLSNITGLGTAIEEGGLVGRLALRLYKEALKNAHCVFFQNQSNRQNFIKDGITAKKTRLIPGSGVNLQKHPYEEYPINNGKIIFLFIGRVMKAKGIDEFLEAAQTIRRSNPHVEFHILGDCKGDYSAILEDMESKGIIRYHGVQSAVHSFIKHAHATIQPSYHEGMSNVLLETAACGRPVLATNVPGCKETFDEGVSGLGFEAKNAESLIDTISKFIELPYEQKRQMGIAGRRKMEREFDRQIVIDSYMGEINQIQESK